MSESKFKARVLQIIKSIPKGRVMSYGQVASLAGSPRSARQVGGVLRASNVDSLPWWRVVNSAGVISIKGNFVATKNLQKQLLVREGVKVSQDYAVDMDVYRVVNRK